jgi:hypothetical protein
MKLQENEKIVKVIKNHYFTNIILWFLTFVFLLILWGIYYFFSDFSYIFMALIILIQIFIVFFYYVFLFFEFWIIVITNQRIISVKKINIFQHKYMEINLSEVREIKAKQKWFFAHYFWFWKLEFEFKSWEKISLKYTYNVLGEAKNIMEIIKK